MFFDLVEELHCVKLTREGVGDVNNDDGILIIIGGNE